METQSLQSADDPLSHLRHSQGPVIRWKDQTQPACLSAEQNTVLLIQLQHVFKALIPGYNANQSRLSLLSGKSFNLIQSIIVGV